ncbi:hypothetical protein [Pseudobdellovibrio sp. HCB154]|uniref:hypothetical protein n=1 Tax=Pseudobdellovibrio sp. HCB154 TaxID=3386277 RepID=UPI0039171382
MRQSTKSSSSKRGSSSSTTSRRSGVGQSGRGSSRSSSKENAREDEDRYGAVGTRMSSRDEYDMGRSDYGRGATHGSDYGRRGSSYGTGTSYGDNSRGDYGREGVRTISGRYSDFEDYGGSSRDREYRDDGERGFARGGRRGEYSSVNDQDFYEGNTGRSPWRDTYESERNYPSRGSSRSQNYSGQGRGYSEFDYDDDRINSRGTRYGSSRGYNESSDYEREARYGSSRDRDERWMNNYDNQDENVEDEYGFRERYNENRY